MIKLIDEPIIENLKLIFIELSGKACFFELIMKLLVYRNDFQVKQESCKGVKNIMYDKFSTHFTKEDKEIIDEAVWIRNKLVHFELSEILKKQEFIPSQVVKGTIDSKDAPNSTLKTIERIQEGKGTPVNKDSPLIGLCLEFIFNPERTQELNETLNKATNIVEQVINKSSIEIK